MKSISLLLYILVIVGLFAWEEFRSTSAANSIEHLYYLVPTCLCMTFGIVFGMVQRLQSKILELEQRLSQLSEKTG